MKYICYETSQCYTMDEWKIFYECSGIVDKVEYPDFVVWWQDMRKSGVLEIA